MAAGQRVTLKEVAQAAQVSVMAVSAVLNHTNKTRVSTAKRELILRVGAQLGYRANIAARTLQGGASRLIGVVVDSQAPDTYSQVLRYLEREAARHGYRLLIAEEHDSSSSVIAACRDFEQYGVDGILCLAHSYPDKPDEVWRFIAERSNIVPVGFECLPESKGAYVDTEVALATVLRHFRECGRRRVGWVSPNCYSLVLERRERAFRRIAKELEMLPMVWHGEFTPSPDRMLQTMRECVEEFIVPLHLEAVMGDNDFRIGALIPLLAERSLQVPKDVALVGWNDSDFCRITVPPLASIDDHPEQLGREAVQLLLTLLRDGQMPESRLTPATFVHRESAG